MAEQEKDNTFTIVALVTALAIGGVVLLKSRETDHLKYQGATDVKSEAQVLAKHKDFNNDILSKAK